MSFNKTRTYEILKNTLLISTKQKNNAIIDSWLFKSQIKLLSRNSLKIHILVPPKIDGLIKVRKLGFRIRAIVSFIGGLLPIEF